MTCPVLIATTNLRLSLRSQDVEESLSHKLKCGPSRLIMTHSAHVSDLKPKRPGQRENVPGDLSRAACYATSLLRGILHGHVGWCILFLPSFLFLSPGVCGSSGGLSMPGTSRFANSGVSEQFPPEVQRPSVPLCMDHSLKRMEMNTSGWRNGVGPWDCWDCELLSVASN